MKKNSINQIQKKGKQREILNNKIILFKEQNWDQYQEEIQYNQEKREFEANPQERYNHESLPHWNLKNRKGDSAVQLMIFQCGSKRLLESIRKWKLVLNRVL